MTSNAQMIQPCRAGGLVGGMDLADDGTALAFMGALRATPYAHPNVNE
jgi:hypothetical protein